MRRLLRLFYVPCSLFLTASAVDAQQAWVGPAEECDVGTGHSLVRGSVQHLRRASETEHDDERASRLNRAHEVLYEALTERDQQDNPAAWYYLGRYYQMMGDAPGADSAFSRVEEAMPECAEDIAYYRSQLRATILEAAYRTWREGDADSAKHYFRAAVAFDPSDARSSLELAGIFMEEANMDSASRYVMMGADAAGDDPDEQARAQRSLRALVGGYTEAAYQEDAMVNLPGRRQLRDSLQQDVSRDSLQMADMMGRVAAVRERGARLDEQSLQVFQRESTAAFTRMDADREQIAAVTPQIEADSVAASAAAAGAIHAARQYAERYPDDVDAAISLARLLSAVGYSAELQELTAGVAADETVSASDLSRLGTSLFNDGQYAAAAPVLDAALSHNGYMQNALLVLTQTYYRMQDGPATLATASRLMEIDPLNTNSHRMMAAAWNLAGERDSVVAAMNRANGGIDWYVSVSQFAVSERGTVLNASVQNVSGGALEATTLLFDFLDPEGNVLYSESAEVPAMAANTRQRVSLRLEQSGATGWRYRRE